MDKQLIQNIAIFLDRVTLTGHKEREVMNQVVAALEELLKENEQDEKPEVLAP